MNAVTLDELATALPLGVIISSEGMIIRTGPTVELLAEHPIIGRPVFDVFTFWGFHAPKSVREFSKATDMQFNGRFVANLRTAFKCRLVHFKSGNTYLLDIGLGRNLPAIIREYGLSENHLSPTDAAPELMSLTKIHQWLLKKAEHTNRDLNFANQELDEQMAQMAFVQSVFSSALSLAKISLTCFDEAGKTLIQPIGFALPVGIQQILGNAPFDQQRLEAICADRRLKFHASSRVEHETLTFTADIENQDGEIWEFKSVQLEQVGQILICSDVTPLRHSEQRLSQKRKMEALGVLAGGVAHDFNNILAIIRAAFDTSGNDPDFLRQESAALDGVFERGKSLIQELLAYSRTREIGVKHIDLNAAFRKLRNFLPATIGPGYDLHISIETDVWLICDPGQFEAMIINLIVNARDSMPSGGDIRISTVETPERDISAYNLDIGREYSTISIEDNGVGITQYQLERIFEPFYTTKKLGQGTGLGLSMAYGFVNRNGGAIYALPKDEGGTIFRIILPSVASISRKSVAVRPVSVSGLTGRRILVVEDELTLLSFYERYLRTIGMVPDVASGFSEAADKIHSNTYDFVVSDINLGDGNGLDLLAICKSVSSPPHVVIISGNASLVPRQVAKVDLSILEKPFSLDDLRQTLSALLS